MKSCKKCGKVESTVTDILTYNHLDLCDRCFACDHLATVQYGEHRDVTRARSKAWLDGCKHGYDNAKPLWFAIGFTGGSVFFGMLHMIGRWFG